MMNQILTRTVLKLKKDYDKLKNQKEGKNATTVMKLKKNIKSNVKKVKSNTEKIKDDVKVIKQLNKNPIKNEKKELKQVAKIVKENKKDLKKISKVKLD